MFSGEHHSFERLPLKGLGQELHIAISSIKLDVKKTWFKKQA